MYRGIPMLVSDFIPVVETPRPGTTTVYNMTLGYDTPGLFGRPSIQPGTIETISFTPGSVTFGGQPVDFSGTEASFIAPATRYVRILPVTSQPGLRIDLGPCCGAGSAPTGPNLWWNNGAPVDYFRFVPQIGDEVTFDYVQDMPIR